MTVNTSSILDTTNPATTVPSDYSAPAVPVILTESVDAANVVTLTGSSDPSDIIDIYDGTSLLGETVATSSGTWTYVAGTLAAGVHNFTATATDLKGGTSAPSPDPTVTIAPAAPVILAASPDSGLASSLTTTSNQLTLTGTAAANTTVTLFDGTTEVGTSTANASGVWTITTSSALATGSHSFTATATDSSGDVSSASGALSISVKADISSFSPLTDKWSAPISVDGTPFYVENANVNGNAPWAITQTDPQTLRFVLQPGDTWSDNGSHRSEIAGGVVYAPGTTINVSYQFELEPGATNQYWTVIGQFHSDDNSAITQSLQDDYPPFAFGLTGAGDTGNGDYLSIFAAYTLPGQTEPTSIDANGKTGGFQNLWVSSAPLVRGQYYSIQVEANFQNNSSGFLDVWVNGVQVVNYNGPLGYGAGTYWKEGIYQDSANTTQTIAADYKNLVISTTPNAPVILTDTVSGSSATLTGTGQANSTITVYDGATKLGTAAVTGAGTWTFQTGQLATGVQALTATATDSAGNVSAVSNLLNATIGTVTTAPTAPSAPSIASFSPDSGTAGDGVTDAQTVSLAGTAAANTTVTVYDGTTKLGTAAAGANGAWTFATGQLATGAHQFTATDTANGVVSAASSALSLTVVAVPTAPVISSSVAGSVAQTLSVTGTGTANSTVTLYDGTTKLGTATVTSAGTWSFLTGQLPTGVQALTATATDPYGNVSAVSNLLNATISTVTTTPTAPSAPSIASFSPDSGTVGDGITDAQTVSLSGTAAANTTVTVYDGTTQLGTAAVGASGAWTFATGQLTTGVHQFTATDTANGVVSAASSALGLTVITAPTAPVISSAQTTSPANGGANTNAITGSQTTQQTVSLTGTALANTTVTLYDGTTELGTTQTNASGAWSFNSSQLSTGTHQFTATDTDAYGDVSSVSAAVSVTIGSSTTSAAPKKPALTIPDHRLYVSPGGSVDLGVSVAVPNSQSNVSVSITGLPSYETITDNLDHKTFSGSSITLTAAEVNSGLSLQSNYTGSGRPVATLSITATNSTAGGSTSSKTKSITVIDPPASSGGSSSSHTNTSTVTNPPAASSQNLALFHQYMAGGFDGKADHGQITTANSANDWHNDLMLTKPHHH